MSPKGQLYEIPKSQDGYRKENTSLFSGGGGLVSTISDYLKFALMLLNRGKLEQIQVLKEKTVELMTIQEHVLSRGMPYMPEEAIKQMNMPPHMEKSILTLSRGFGVGLGVQIKMEENPNQIKIPVGVFGWGGAFLTDFWVDPKNKLVGIVLSQFANGVYFYPLKVEVRELVYQGLKL